jgi:peptidoglycan DL-endopeptidase CwlO
VNGLLAVQSRIAELQGRIEQLTPARTTTVAATSTGTSSTGTSFAGALTSAMGGLGGTGATAGGSATSAASLGPLGGGGEGRATAQGLIASAKKYLGVPYLWGGTDPAKGLDCSALVQRAMKDIGVDVPRVVADQRHLGTEVPSLAQARPGDLIVMGGSRHIGIYVGDGKMLHAPKTGDVVRIGSVYETPTSIRRVLPQAGPSVSAASWSPSAVAPTGGAGGAGISAAVRRYEPLFASATARYGLPPGLLAAVAQVESGGNASAVSPAGAQGLMQIMPATAKGLGVDALDPAQAVDGAARLLQSHLRTFGSLDLALAAYNAGPGAVRRYDGVPPYAETQGYVRKVGALLGRAA